jgi:chromosome partitioning protein
MITIALVATKGGVSKSTLCTNLATIAAADGDGVLVIDLDPQESAAQWSVLRGGRPPEVVAGLPKQLAPMLDAARDGGADVVFIDTQGHAAQSGAAAARCADVVIVPCRTSAPDILAVADTIELLQAADAKCKAVAVLLAPGPKSKEIPEAEAALGEVHGLMVLGAHVTERKDYRDAFKAGEGVVEMNPGSVAAGEMRGLWGEIKSYIKVLEKRKAHV